MRNSRIIFLIMVASLILSCGMPAASETYNAGEADTLTEQWHSDIPQNGICQATMAEHSYDSGYVCTACQVVSAKLNGTEYTELTAALDAADENNIVVLQRDVKVEDLNFYTTLDLNGMRIAATGIVDASNAYANIVDNVSGGFIDTQNLKMYRANKQLAIDAENNYRYSFETVELMQKVEKLDSDRASVKFYINKASADTQLDDAILAGSEVKIRITVSWTSGGEEKNHSFVYTQDLVDDYVEGWDNKMFTCTISGLEELGEYTITADVVSCNVIVGATEARRLLTWKEYLALTSAEQRAYKESFENRDDYYQWLEDARAAYDAEQETEMDGNIDIGDIVN